MYCWLSSLEDQLNDDGKLPDTVYLQVDGGEMTVQALLIAELLVHKGLTRKVVVTRLLVGHTHEVRLSRTAGFISGQTVVVEI
jgi:hypothetical protein